MTYNKKTVNKASITKKSLWSLVLAAKERSYSRENEDSSISITKIIGKNEYKFTYNLNTQVISKCNFLLNEYSMRVLSLFLPIIFNEKSDPYIIAHLAQTLDGFIATKTGESKYISSEDNLIHIHMIRAISDVIIVGYKTVKLDNPMLTTRLVRGHNPMRLIIDKNNKLSKRYNVFSNSDGNGYKLISDTINTKNDNIFQLPLVKNKFDTNDISLLMKKLGKRIIFIEGGGATVSNLYNRNNLDRIHLCISPIILGKGRSSFIMQENTSLNDVINHNIEYYQMGKDILCDIKLS